MRWTPPRSRPLPRSSIPSLFISAKRTRDKSFFQGLAASGWHTAAITMSLLVKSGMPIAGGLIGAGGEIDWPRPTRPGDVLQVESEVLAVTPSRSKPERGMITVRSETKNQKGEVVQILTSKMLVWQQSPRLAASAARALRSSALWRMRESSRSSSRSMRRRASSLISPRA